MRKRERTWKDEVRERVRERRTSRSELPLFPEPAEGEPVEEEPRVLEAAGDEPEPEPEQTAVPAPEGFRLDDMPLRDEPAGETESELRMAPAVEDAPRVRPAVYTSGPADPRMVTQPVERPATAAERAQAALIDLCLLVPTAALVVYGAARAGQTQVDGLRSVWPWLLGYLAAVGLVYAGYFTGIAGRTVGKMVVGLRVLGPGDVAPGWGRATLRAALGSVGVMLAGSGLVTVFTDAARRAVHDLLLHTRVVKG
jgi:uncharacterized RDD family membrane protein YckC